MHSPKAASTDHYPVRQGRLQKAHIQKRLFLLVAIAPAFGGYLLFTLYPNLLSVYYAFLNWDGMTKPVYVGFDNFVTMVHDRNVWNALLHNLIYMATVPFFVVAISLLLAYLLTNKTYRGTSFFKVLFFFPNVLSTVVIALLWAFIYDGSFGILNAILRMIGIDTGGFYWLGETNTALWAVIPPYVWGGVGLYVIIFVNAMTTIPRSFYESAIIDGAGHATRFVRITLPLILPIVRVGVLFLVLGTLKGFEHVLILTNGGPAGSTEVIGLYMFSLAFGNDYHNYGYASAIGMLLFVILVLAKLVMDKTMPNRSVEY